MKKEEEAEEEAEEEEGLVHVTLKQYEAIFRFRLCGCRRLWEVKSKKEAVSIWNISHANEQPRILFSISSLETLG